jgi:Flp pilus assembly protein TadD
MNKNLKRLTIVTAFLLLQACASTPEETENPVVDGTESAEAKQALGETEAPEPGKEDSPSAPPVAKESTPVARSALKASIRSGNDEAVFRAASVALSQTPNDIMALNAIGFYYYRKSQFLAAQYFFSRALKVEPKNSVLHNNLGLVNLSTGELRDAIKSFRKAIELDSSNATAAANLGAIYIQNKDFNRALVALEMAYVKFKKDPKVVNNYAIALTAAGKNAEAEDVYEDAIKLSNNNKDVLFNYAILLIEKLNKNKEGLEVINKIRFLGLSADTKSKINELENRAKSGLK